ncbi:DUF4232 domain-containing protein [Saccharothrix sp. Mg75]|uniref:DUF4232 domain-containing protein n=1 Tax=Saccharothrix sp. Mg75 TaxID=3445357 RepID=UPI003EE85B02
MTATLVALVAATALVGCSSTSKSKSSKGGSTTAKSTKSAKTTNRSKPVERCDDLGVTAVPGSPADGGRQALVIVFTNRDDGDCTVSGFPGVRLDGADGLRWDIAREEGAETAPLTLTPGGRAAATLTYAPQPDGWEVRGLVVTPPGTTAAQELAWPAGRVLLQDGATRPATHVGQVAPYSGP